MKNYISLFKQYIHDFLIQREMLKYSNSAYEVILYSFDRFCVEYFPEEQNLTSELVNAWLTYNGKRCINSSNITVIRMFGRYLQSIGCEAFIPPERFYGQNKRHIIQHIFTNEEIIKLFASIDSNAAKASYPFGKFIFPVYFRLVFTSGLRPREAREIIHSNVDFKTGIIRITQTKGNKDRIVVTSDDMLTLLRSYNEKRQFFYMDNNYLFPGKDSTFINENTYSRYLQLCWERAFPDIEKDKLPQIRTYDLRHQFATLNINRWLDQGKDLMAMLPRLREYMGHKSFNETAYYIHLMPENITKNRGIDWNAFNGIIPEVIE